MSRIVMTGFNRSNWHHADEDNRLRFQGAIPVEAVRDQLFGWNAEKVDLTYQFNGSEQTAPDRVGIINGETGRLLNVVSPSYEIAQYQDCLLGNVRQILGNGLGIEAAGVFGGGEVAWLSISLPDTTTTSEGVEFMPHLLAYASHNSKFAVGYARSTTMTVCDNQISATRKGTAQKYSIRHTKNAGLRIENARIALGILGEIEDDFSRQVRELCEVTVTDKQWAQFVEAYVPIAPDAEKGRVLTVAENKRDSLTTLWNSDVRVSPWKNTAFGVFQAANTWLNHVSIVRGADRPERNLLNNISGKLQEFDSNTLATLDKVLATV